MNTTTVNNLSTEGESDKHCKIRLKYRYPQIHSDNNNN